MSSPLPPLQAKPSSSSKNQISPQIPKKEEDGKIGRKVLINDHLGNAHKENGFLGNQVSTGKYTLWSFIPKNLFEQFRRLANIYFLLISCLQLFTNLSPTGRYTTIAPLSAVLFVIALKEALEDIKRHNADKEVNNREALVLRDGAFVTILWHEIVVGDIVKVPNRTFIPADIVMLATSEPLGMAYVETSNLDGETNLKIQQAHPDTADFSVEQIANLKAVIECDAPNNSLYTFNGALEIESDGKKERLPLGPKQVLLRGAMLRNTGWAIGVAVYTGHQAKVMLNANETRSKTSSVEKRINLQIFYIFVFLMLLCFFSAVGFGVWAGKWGKKHTYLMQEKDTGSSAVVSFFTFLILYNNLIPISLYVSLELVKFIQAYLIGMDVEMYDEISDTPALARTSNLNEELGQIDYIFSDKTGTLTQNLMEFRKCSIAGVSYGTDEEIPVPDRVRRGMPVNFNFTDPRFVEHLAGRNLTPAEGPDGPGPVPNPELLRMFLVSLSVCHTVIPEVDRADPAKIIYQASSPDESALVSAGKQFGYYFRARTPRTVTVCVNGKDEVYEILNILEFNSTRKRMSIIARCPDGRILLMCKGADTVIYERLAPGCSFADVTLEQLESFAVIGLRTLCLGYRYLEEAPYRAWNETFKAAAASLVGRADKLADCAEVIEKDLLLIGATAIEDKLQVGVPEAIATLMRGGIKVWVLTGDKQETAINIGFSAQLLTRDMRLLVINSEDKAVVSKIIEGYLTETDATPPPDPKTLATVVDGHTLRLILEDKALASRFLKQACRCSAVICCRVSPLQKALVVTLVKDSLKCVTLAIGDGANDVSMIQAAHVGVGISGQEGLQAARSADYSIAQFRFLLRLLLVHGRWSYRRVSKLICYSFYKNIALYLTQFWYIFFNGYSGQTLYDGWTIALFNIAFAAFPVIIYAIVDQDVSAEMSLRVPQLYQYGQKSAFFNTIVFWQWFATAVFHSFVLFMIPAGIMSHGNYLSGGQVAGLFCDGVITFTTVVIAVNLKAAIEFNYWTKASMISLFLSVALVIIFYLPYHVISSSGIDLGNDMYWIIYRLFEAGTFYFTLLIVPVITVLRDYVWRVYKRNYDPEMYHIVQEIQRMEEKDPSLKTGENSLENSPFFKDTTNYQTDAAPTTVQGAQQNANAGNEAPLSERVNVGPQSISTGSLTSVKSARSTNAARFRVAGLATTFVVNPRRDLFRGYSFDQTEGQMFVSDSRFFLTDPNGNDDTLIATL